MSEADVPDRPPSEPLADGLCAADVGNARIKVGRFAAGSRAPLPEPESTMVVADEAGALDPLATWLGAANPSRPQRWYLASVNRPGATRLIDWLRRNRPADCITLLSAADLPLAVQLPRPDMVGIDRLVDAVAANRLRELSRPAVIVDVGSAITVDLVSADGAFLGGAILPGLAMAARALHEFTDLLPLIDVSEFREAPSALGRDTEEAMQSGLYWGAVGAVRALTEELGRAGGGAPQVFLTGGAGDRLASLLRPDARYVPHLTLAGIAVSASGASERPGNRLHSTG